MLTAMTVGSASACELSHSMPCASNPIAASTELRTPFGCSTRRHSTAVAAMVFGPWAGVVVGLSTNVFGFVVGAPGAAPFALVNVAGALVWGYGIRRFGMGADLFRYVNLTLLVAVACSLVGAPLGVLMFGGYSGHGSDNVTSSIAGLGLPVVAAAFSANILTSVIDKMLSGFIALVGIAMLRSRVSIPTAQIPLVERLIVQSGQVSGNRLELGLVPVGAFSLIVLTVVLAAVVGREVATIVTLIAIGVSAGLYIVPMYTLLQHRAPKESKGSMVATSNFLNVTGGLVAVIVFYFVTFALQGVFGLSMTSREASESEAALRATTMRFRDRFMAMERLAVNEGVPLTSAPVEEIRALWERVAQNPSG